jgi:hypothetical protein
MTSLPQTKQTKSSMQKGPSKRVGNVVALGLVWPPLFYWHFANKLANPGDAMLLDRNNQAQKGKKKKRRGAVEDCFCSRFVLEDGAVERE